MPGIAGIIGPGPACEREHAVRLMVATMRHEPFYDSGWTSVPEIGVYVGWTAHAGSYSARQSVCDTGRVRTIIAGECVGTPAETDIAKAYEERGDAFVRTLNGLFSGLIIDRSRGCALLFNDRYGLERLYTHQSGEAVYFASEAKALLAALPELRCLSDEGVAQFMAFGSTRGRQTLFKGVDLLDGGSLCRFEGGQRRVVRYITPESLETAPVLEADEFNEEFAATFKKALPRYVRDGAGLGISLTAGLDTRMIMACMLDTPYRLTSYTFSGLSERTLDERIAARVAATRGLDHQVVRIESDFLSDYGRRVDKSVFITDGCFGATGAHEVYLNAKARALAPIRLTGNYGSEVLRSMSTFKPLGLTPRLFADDFAPRVLAASDTPAEDIHPVTFAAFREIPFNLFGSLSAGRSQLTMRTPYMDNDIVSLAYRAPGPSRRSSASALRVITDGDEQLARIATDRGVVSGGKGIGYTLRRAFAEVTFKLDCVHLDGLPERLARFDPLVHGISKTLGVIGLHKYLPYRLWFKNQLQPYVHGVLSDGATRRMPYWKPTFLDSLAVGGAANGHNHTLELNAVLTLESIDRQLIRGSYPSDAF